ncbi:MAG: rod shape-determining protein MreC [Bacteroidota bacterium]
MRKLIAFFRRFRVFLIFLMLQLFALGSYFSLVQYPRTKFFNTSNQVSATLLNWERELTKYLYLDQTNREIMAENASLSRRIPDSYISVDSKTAIVDDTIHHLAYEKLPATVINSTYQHKNNFFTIDAGALKGVEKKMGVVSSTGAVGIVYDVSDHFAVVKSVLTKTINISAYINGSNAHGLIKYLENDPRRVKLTGISNDIRIKKGARVFTRGSGGYFPQGILIGKVENKTPIEGKPLWDITVRLEQDMRKLRYVYVLKNIHQKELQELEEDYEDLQ